MKKIKTLSEELTELQIIESFIHEHTGLEFCFDGCRISGLQKTNPIRFNKFIKEQKKLK
jgi:hypothetical protein